jgi:hypothetical protein
LYNVLVLKLTFFLLLAFSSVSFSNESTIRINWNYKNFNSAKMQLYEVDNKLPVWYTKNAKNIQATLLKEPIKDGILKLAPNRVKKFALVMQNDTSEPIYFFAAPHSTTPDELSLGLKFKCLCINHAFIIEPKSIWYRVVQISLHPGYVGKEMDLTHSIIGLDKKKATQFRKNSLKEEDPNHH